MDQDLANIIAKEEELNFVEGKFSVIIIFQKQILNF
jgi:hypothetical protein